jgi:hypothetical protein
MRRIRFNIASLLVVVLFVAVGVAALRESSDLWESGIFTLALAALLISILLAIHRTAKPQAFWIGFALFGSAYLGFALVPSIESRLITTKALAYLASKVPGRPPEAFTVGFSATDLGFPVNRVQTVAFDSNGTQLATSSQGTVRLWDLGSGKLLSAWRGTSENFAKIGHSLLSLIAGILGGLLSRHLYTRNRESATM